MVTVLLVCIFLIAATTVFHYEVLRVLTVRLPGVAIPKRTKLLAVIFTTFAAHAVEIVLYAFGIYALIHVFEIGGLKGGNADMFMTCLYMSGELYTSLGLGDVVPLGPIRLVAAVEALNGLLLIAWSASYAYLSMEKFWSTR